MIGPAGESSTAIYRVPGSAWADELQRKLATYARIGIPDYWPVDLACGRVFVQRDPRADNEPSHDGSVVPHGRHETLVALAVDDLVIGTNLLLQMSATP